jgi:hypothetical protein
MRSLFRTAALAVLLTACHDSSTGPSASSLFSATVTGAFTATLEGTSVALAEASNRRPYAVLLNEDPETAAHNGLSLGFFGGGTRLSVRSYPATNLVPSSTSAPPTFLGVLFTNAVPSPYGLAFISTSGTVTIEAVSASRVKGRFDLQMATDPLAGLPQRTVHVVGRFNAPVHAAEPCDLCLEQSSASGSSR